ncbi:MAG: patatin-like phospholipase family protein [Alphaproteobacteria bacterium]
MLRFPQISLRVGQPGSEIPLGQSGPLRGLEHLPERLLRVLPGLTLFEGLKPADMKALLGEFEWFSLPGGWKLMRRGQEGNSIYVVTAGSLGLFLPGRDGEDYMAGQFVPGQTVGELALLSGEPRMATVVALRDTELLRLTAPVFEKLAKRHPVVMRNLARLLVRRLKETMAGRRDPGRRPSAPKTVAIMPATSGVPGGRMARELVKAIGRLDLSVKLLDESDAEQNSDWFHELETENDHVIYLAGGRGGPWDRLCLRQADRVLIVGDARMTPPRAIPVDDILQRRERQMIELVVLHSPQAATGRGAGPWCERFEADIHHNLRLGRNADICRLARHLSGRGVGLVMAGGGARGFAHLGVLRALEEKGIIIDRLGGTSMGGIVAAGAALGWKLDDLEQRMYDSFVRTNPLSDVTLPWISLVRGRKVTNLLKTNFGDARIEEAWRNYFCVSSNLTTGREYVHREGPFWQALRASVAIPGILPPVIHEGEVLVDGAIINNFPADIMDAMLKGPIMGADVERHDRFTLEGPHPEDLPFWGRLGAMFRGGPALVSLLIRSGTVNSEAQSRQSQGKVDLLVEPDLKGVTVTSWKAFETAVKAGYESTLKAIEASDEAFTKPDYF